MDITLSDYDGRTALHLAASEGHFECVEFLLGKLDFGWSNDDIVPTIFSSAWLVEQCNVPHDPRDRWGNTPVDEAETFGHHKVVEFLQNYDNKMKSQAAIQKVLDDEAKSYGVGGDGASGDDSVPPPKGNVLYDKSATSTPFPDDDRTDPKSMF